MKPPAPNPVSGHSTANEASTAATAASTALPPARSDRGARLGALRVSRRDDAGHPPRSASASSVTLSVPPPSR